MTTQEITRTPADRLRSSRFWITLALSLSLAGVHIWVDDFAKIQFGSLFILEWIFIFWALFVVTNNRQFFWTSSWKNLTWPYVLLGYGLLVLGLNLAGVLGSGQLSDVGVKRLLQNSIFFVYPAIWITVGYWLGRRNHVARFTAISIMFASTLAGVFWGKPTLNFCLGIVMLIPATWWAARVWQSERPKAWNLYRSLAFGVAILALTFVPFWMMWLEYLKRTLLMLFIVDLAAMTFLILPQLNALKRVVIAAAASVILVGGYLASTAIFYSSKEIKQVAIDSLHHAEDKKQHLNPEGKKFSHRGYLWKSTIRDWQTAPVFGVGMIPIVPSTVPYGRPNNAQETRTGGPISAHNSYLVILARFGVVGSLIFLGFLLWIGRMVWIKCRELRASSVFASAWSEGPMQTVLVIFVLNGLAHAFFNVGLESPHYCVTLWCSLGMLVGSPQIPHREV